MYLPALDQMEKLFDISVTMMNLSLVLFFLFFGLSTLIFGPLSDKYGRKPILFTGISLYFVSSILCGFSDNIYELITFRILQAIGGGAPVSVSLAIIKDLYEGRKREKILAIATSLNALGPILAPIIGSSILLVFDWPAIFFYISNI